MKHLKTYESTKSDLQIGNYVIMRSTVNVVKDFVENNVGQIEDIDYDEAGVTIKYFNVPRDLHDYFLYNTRDFDLKLIQHISKSKEELEALISQNKFNL